MPVSVDITFTWPGDNNKEVYYLFTLFSINLSVCYKRISMTKYEIHITVLAYTCVDEYVHLLEEWLDQKHTLCN